MWKEARVTPETGLLQEWKLSRSKGEFFFEEDGSIVSHHYQLDLREDSDVWITVEPYSIKPGGIWCWEDKAFIS